MNFVTAILLLVCFRINSPSVLQLRPMKEIISEYHNRVMRTNADIFYADPDEPVPTSTPIPVAVQLSDNKPECGPVPFPDFSCEDTTVTVDCRPRATVIKDIVPLYKKVETTWDTQPTTVTVPKTISTETTTKSTVSATTPTTKKTTAVKSTTHPRTRKTKHKKKVVKKIKHRESTKNVDGMTSSTMWWTQEPQPETRTVRACEEKFANCRTYPADAFTDKPVETEKPVEAENSTVAP